ncbi:fimbria/pilus outer membrane usher protein [Stenotrophomonas sp. 24(2023)]|uniref:fimbria/pilus outer membrane usher protein n=1 Tax=Stenotrophomonas sp. 24(2023) TaxID=3068324 RepID=UPI0027DED7AF|nr:fimbria/pilus outer membrane usher protein [Stenotrophomonas sp. 24(2023)]WMJ68504.1 fimbria/pilus outer membrane usher protein [Stenotrophomonas sp. 24(2023)]
MAAALGAALAPASLHAADVSGVSADVMLPPPTPLTAGQTLYLDVQLNRTPRGLLPFVLLGGRLQASPEVLRQLGFNASGQAPVYLDQISGVVVRYDARLQTLALDVPLDQLTLPTTQLSQPQIRPPAATASPGVLLNYDVYASQVDSLGNLSLGSELRVFGLGNGTLENTAISRRYQQSGDRRWRGESVRLDTRWTLDFPERALTLEVGDFYSGFVDWTRPVRMGGVQIGRNYGLQPYRVLTPTPAFLGQAVVPSTVELYVDGLRQYSGQVPIGPFQLAAQPGISGTGSAQVVVTDAFGRMQTLDFSFYGTQQLLAKGLSDWSLGVGRLRENFGIHSFDYDGRTVANASWRGGISDRFTGEVHAEGGGGLAQAGAGGWWLLGGAGVFNAAYARSRYEGLGGGQLALGYSWNNRHFNLNLRSVRSHGDYRDLGALQGNLPPDLSEQATVGVDLRELGSLSASYLRLRYPDGEDNRYASLFWSRSFNQRWSAYLSLNQNLDRSSDRSVYLSLNANLGDNRQASLSTQRNGDRQSWVADVSRPVPGDGSAGGIGWRAQVRQSDGDVGGLAEVGLLNDVGRYSLGVSRQAGLNYAYGSASGSLVWMGGHGFATREVSDAFAVVSTNGVAGVPVRLENRLIGVTDTRGLLLVTPVLSWQRNRVSIDTLDLPADMRADSVEAAVTPRQRAGAQVNFNLRARAVLNLVLQDMAGTPLDVGSEVLLPDGRQATVGYDGLLYLEDVPAGSVLYITTSNGPCRIRVPAPPKAAASGASVRPAPIACIPEVAP